MARITCKACGKVYSDRVNKCPECGEPKPTHLWRKISHFLEFLLIVAVIYGGWRFIQAQGWLNAWF